MANRSAVLSSAVRWLMHDMRSPVQALCLMTQLEGDQRERAGEVGLAGALADFCRRVSGDLELLERLVRPTAERAPEPISIAESVRFVEDLVRKGRTSAALQVSTDMATLPAATGAQEDLDLALLTLVLNALESDGEPAGSIRIGALVEESITRLWVEDDAARMSTAVLEQLSTDSGTLGLGRSGSALRLLAARSLVRRWGGDLLVSEVPRGNRFDLILRLWPRRTAA